MCRDRNETCAHSLIPILCIRASGVSRIVDIPGHLVGPTPLVSPPPPKRTENFRIIGVLRRILVPSGAYSFVFKQVHELLKWQYVQPADSALFFYFGIVANR